MIRSIATDATLWVRGYRLTFGVLTLFAVGLQRNEAANPINFFSFFTIQSNVIAAIVLLIGAVLLPNSRAWDVVRGGAAIYLVLTGVIYNTLLLNVDVQISADWINNLLHRIMPVVMLADLLLVPFRYQIRWRQATVWSLYPLIYLCYSLARGAVVDWYPYPFLDPRREGGMPRVMMFSVVVLLGFLTVSWLMTRLNAWQLRRTFPDRAQA